MSGRDRLKMATAEEVVLAKKYPKTPHLPFSPGIAEDDIVMQCPNTTGSPLINQEVVVTEKLDGGNCSIYRGKVYARTTNSESTHPSFGPVKQLSAQISYLLPDNIQLFGENMFAVHSIEYDGLGSFLYVFAALEDGVKWLSWDDVAELADSLGLPTVPILTRTQFQSLAELQEFIDSRMQLPSHCGSCFPEGFVVRVVESFPFASLHQHTAKYVRKGHIQTTDDWSRTWKHAKLKT